MRGLGEEREWWGGSDLAREPGEGGGGLEGGEATYSRGPCWARLR